MPSTPSVAFDTTVLSSFAAAERLDVLCARYAGRGYTTADVVAELTRGVRAGYSYLERALAQMVPLSPGGWLSVLSPESPQEFALRSELDLTLGPGESPWADACHR